MPAFRHLLAVQACFGLAYSTFLVLPKHLATGLGAGAAEIGLVMGAFGVANVAAAPGIALLLPRVGPRRGLVLASLLMTVVGFGFSLVDRPGLLAGALRALQGISWAISFAAGGSLVAALAPAGRLHGAITLHSTANLVTNAIAPAVAEPALARFGPGPVFGAAGALAIVVAMLAARLPAGGPGPGGGADGAPRSARPPLPHFLILTGGVLGLACGTMFTFYQPLALLRGMDRVSDFLVAYTVAAVAVRLGLGRLSERIGAPRIAFGSFLLYGLVVAATARLGPGELPIYGALFGVAHGLFFPAFIALALRGAPASGRDRLLGWINAAFNGGGAAVAALGLLGGSAGFQGIFVPVGGLVLLTAFGLFLRRGAATGTG